MLLSSIFEQLTYGEFSQLSLAGIDGEDILPENYSAVVSHINLGLTELHKRFPLKMEEVLIQQYADITSYKLDEDFTETKGTQPTLYILDSLDPFTNTVLRIEKVYNNTLGEYESLNDDNDEDTLVTTKYNTIKVPSPTATTTMTVTYRSTHERILTDTLDPYTYDVDIPDSLIEALLFYVASRAHSSLPTLDTGVNEGNVYLAKFEASVAKITELSLITNVNRTNNKMWTNGWV